MVVRAQYINGQHTRKEYKKRTYPNSQSLFLSFFLSACTRSPVYVCVCVSPTLEQVATPFLSIGFRNRVLCTHCTFFFSLFLSPSFALFFLFSFSCLPILKNAARFSHWKCLSIYCHINSRSICVLLAMSNCLMPLFGRIVAAAAMIFFFPYSRIGVSSVSLTKIVVDDVIVYESLRLCVCNRNRIWCGAEKPLRCSERLWCMRFSSFVRVVLLGAQRKKRTEDSLNPAKNVMRNHQKAHGLPSIRERNKKKKNKEPTTTQQNTTQYNDNDNDE